MASNGRRVVHIIFRVDHCNDTAAVRRVDRRRQTVQLIEFATSAHIVFFFFYFFLSKMNSLRGLW